MIVDQIVILTILAAIFALFLWGRWRYDIVAFAALLIAVVVGVVAPGDAFAGFSHPATVTVATVLILSRALTNSGVTDLIARATEPATSRTVTHLGALSGIAAVMSSFMNNVGALALLMPVAIRSAKQAERPASIILMPLSFASILDGLITLIGTPPNIIIATYRGQVTGTPFKMFDFLPVGGTVAFVGCIFIITLGWRLIASTGRAKTALQDLFQIDDYVTQARVPRGAKIVGMSFVELEELAARSDAQIVGLTRRDRRYTSLPKSVPIAVSERLIIEAGPAEIDKVVTELGLKIVGTEGAKSALLHAEGSGPLEAVVQSGSRLEGRTVESMRFPSRYGVHLLADSRQGRPFRDHLNALHFRVGDVLLLHGDLDQVPEVISSLGCLPLAQRGLQFGAGRRIALSIAIYGTAIAATAMNVLPLQVALGLAVVAMVVTNIMPPARTLREYRLAGNCSPRRHDPDWRRARINRRNWYNRQCHLRSSTRHSGYVRTCPVVRFHDDPYRYLEQRCDSSRHGADRGSGCRPSGRQLRPILDGGRGWRLLRIPDADRPSEQRADHGPWWLQVW